MRGYEGEKIWIDDMRPAPEGYRWCKTYKSAIATIMYFDSCVEGIDEIDFDHDLGEAKSGYDVAKFLVENHISIGGFRCHSMNPVGKENIQKLLIHYGYNLLN